MEQSESLVPLKKAGIKKRTFFCRIILSMALTYFLILALLFLSGLIFSERIVLILSDYFHGTEKFPYLFRWFAIGGTLLYFTSVSGIILFFLKRKIGFYIFFLAALITFSIDLAFFDFDWLRYLIHTGFIFILGIAHFSKRCYG